jgi:predicted phosphodiesterase
MKILVISDIHANITALEAVLLAAGEIDAAWCLGDIVGYGADLNECVQRVRSLPNLLCVKGNHDMAISNPESLAEFNHAASQAILLSRKIITEDNIAFLQKLPERVSNDIATCAHGSPRNPIWEYILDGHVAKENLENFSTPLGFVGHSHLPMMFLDEAIGKPMSRHFPLPGEQVSLTTRAILNPGSVGQPRDNDPRASFGIFNPGTMTWQIQRVEYDIPAVQARIIAAGLPERHARRLSEGW